MTEIEDRGLIFKSYKSYTKFLIIEIKKLQQLLTSKEVSDCFKGAKKEAKWKKIPFREFMEF